MAAKLKDNVVKIGAARKAKGAKSTGGRKAAPRAKPRPGESQPAARNPSDHPSDAEVRQNTQNRLIALHQGHRKVEAQMSAASEVLSSLREQKAQIRASIQNTCIPLAIYDELHGKVTKKTKRMDNELYERQRAMAFEAFGLPCGPAPELDFDKVPEAARPAVHWETVGYQAAIDGQFADYDRDGVPPENYSDYTRGFTQGGARNAAGIKSLKSEPAKAAPPQMVGEDPAKAAAKEAARVGTATANEEVADNNALSADAQPDWSGFDHDIELWSAEQWKTFETWFYALPTDGEVDLDHPGVEKAFDLEVAKPAPPVSQAQLIPTAGEAIAGPAPAGVIYMLSSDEVFASGRQATYRDGAPLDTTEPGAYPVYDEHPLEASAEELSQQAGRPGGARDAQEPAAAFSDD